MKIAFTICSNNYLAQAKTLGDSLVKTNPSYSFFIILVDKISKRVDYSLFKPFTVIPASDIGIKDFDSIVEKYNLIELNTAVKASSFKFLFRCYPDSSFVIYLDPDIMVLDSLEDLQSDFESNEILLTPHITAPIPLDNQVPQEPLFLSRGMFNLGFIGVKNNSANTMRFLNWWEERTLTLGYIRLEDNLFTDQIWINFVPLFFDGVQILKKQGYNVAPWNLQERKIVGRKKDCYEMQDGSFLTFYHFSSYDYRLPNRLSKYYPRNTFDTRPYVRPLYREYRKRLLQNKVQLFSEIECSYVHKENSNIPAKEGSPHDETTTKKKISVKDLLKHLLPGVVFSVYRKMRSYRNITVRKILKNLLPYGIVRYYQRRH